MATLLTRAQHTLALKRLGELRCTPRERKRPAKVRNAEAVLKAWRQESYVEVQTQEVSYRIEKRRLQNLLMLGQMDEFVSGLNALEDQQRGNRSHNESLNK